MCWEKWTLKAVGLRVNRFLIRHVGPPVIYKIDNRLRYNLCTWFHPYPYQWTTSLLIPADITITGGANDIFIFQVAGTMDMGPAVQMTLTGGVQAKNIYWQVAGAVTLGTTSHFEGVILGATGINLTTGATINGRLFAQTAITLQKNTVTKP